MNNGFLTHNEPLKQVCFARVRTGQWGGVQHLALVVTEPSAQVALTTPDA